MICVINGDQVGVVVVVGITILIATPLLHTNLLLYIKTTPLLPTAALFDNASVENHASMSVQQRDVVWDWAQGMPSRSSLHGVGISMRLHAGSRGLFSVTLYDARNRSRLWSLRAEAPLAKPLDIYLSADRAWQARTTDDTPPRTSPR